MTTIIINGKVLDTDELIAVESSIRIALLKNATDMEKPGVVKASRDWNTLNFRRRALTRVIEIIDK